MRNELGEKFVQAINERDQKTYLECFKQRVDVNYQSTVTGLAAIHAAAESGNHHAIGILLKEHPEIDLLILSKGHGWLASDIAALVMNHALADILDKAEQKQMEERGITREDLEAKAAQLIEENLRPTRNIPFNIDEPTND